MLVKYVGAYLVKPRKSLFLNIFDRSIWRSTNKSLGEGVAKNKTQEEEESGEK